MRVRLLRGAFDGLNGFLVRINYLLLAIIAIYLIFFSNAFRIFSIRVGAVQNHSFLFCQNPAKRAAVARRHFVA